MAKKLNQACVLAINGGSSRIKFALCHVGEALEQRLCGKVDRIGLSGTNLTFHELDGKPQASRSLSAADHKSAASLLIDWFEAQKAFASVKAVGHRVVHGMTHSEPEQVTPELIDELHRITPHDPEHLPREIELIEAVALFCYQVKKWIGAFAAVLGGLDTLVFAGGIGENAPTVRARICEGLGFLGIELEEKRNAANEGVISTAAGRVPVRIIRTDEEGMIAKTVCRVLGFPSEKEMCHEDEENLPQG